MASFFCLDSCNGPIRSKPLKRSTILLEKSIYKVSVHSAKIRLESEKLHKSLISKNGIQIAINSLESRGFYHGKTL
jgi:hypothetical protein